jgi:hypothetical protein
LTQTVNPAVIHTESTTYFFNILEKKMPGGETACFAAIFYLDTRVLFVKVGAM